MWKLLDLLQEELDKLDTEDEVNSELMRDIVDYTSCYTDIFHHPKEDAIYARLLEYNTECHDAVEAIFSEHRRQARLTHDYLNMLNALIAGDFVSREPLQESTREYIELNRSHINREESDLFPRAQATLQEADWLEVEQEVAAGEDPLAGGNASEAYAQLYERLAGMD
jgi:hemerythrin-like domain-containing protein